jgi:hypothetical protein
MIEECDMQVHWGTGKLDERLLQGQFHLRFNVFFL